MASLSLVPSTTQIRDSKARRNYLTAKLIESSKEDSEIQWLTITINDYIYKPPFQPTIAYVRTPSDILGGLQLPPYLLGVFVRQSRRRSPTRLGMHCRPKAPIRSKTTKIFPFSSLGHQPRPNVLLV